MKTKFVTILLCAFTVLASARVKKVSTTRLEISFDKTLHLVFDSKVKYIDGATDIQAEIVPNLPNIVKVVVTQENYKGTRGLSVITADGVFHSFELTFKEDVDY